MPLHECYDGNPDLSQKYQGDILADVVILVPPPVDRGMYLLRPSSPVTVADALAGKVPKAFLPRAENNLTDAWEGAYEFVLAKAKRGPAQIVTQTCDLDHRSVVHVAPVYPLTQFPEAAKRDSVRAGDVGYLHPLPGDDSFTESYADLSQVTWVPKAAIRAAVIVRRLTPTALTTFQHRLSRLQGRLFTFTASDDVPQVARYLCLRCFLTHAVVVAIEPKAGDKFPTCTSCQGAFWIKQVPPDAS
jgi:hypothetical protein